MSKRRKIEPVEEIENELERWFDEYGTDGVFDTIINIFERRAKHDENGCETSFKIEAAKLRKMLD